MTRKHVFRDLRPYVCTFHGCPKSDRLFNTRHDWYDHEVEFHRREWFCSSCIEAFPTKARLREHLRHSHSDIFTETQPTAIDRVVDRCERAIDSVQPCPLCVGKYTPQKLQSHLARHMQQLALFALPRTAGFDEEGESVGAQASIPDEDGSEESLVDGTGRDQGYSELDLLPDPDPDSVDDVFAIDEIPDVQNETWGYLKAPEPAVIKEEDKTAEPVIFIV